MHTAKVVKCEQRNALIFHELFISSRRSFIIFLIQVGLVENVDT